MIDADAIGWNLLEKSAPTYSRVVREFGPGILDKHGNIIRHKLGALVFGHGPSLARLNRIVHPALLAELERRVMRTRQPAVRVIDAALLFFWGWERKVDWAILVAAPRDQKIARLRKTGISRRQAEQRLRSQMSDSEMRRCAGIVIHNDGTPAELRAACRLVWQIVTADGKRPTANR